MYELARGNHGNRLCEKSFEVPNLWQRDMYSHYCYFVLYKRAFA